MSCNGNGYLSGNTLVSFPFEDGQSIQWRVDGSDSGSDSSPTPSGMDGDGVNGAQAALDRCFADACVFLEAEPEESGHWPSACCFSVSGDVLSFRMCALGHEIEVSARASSERFPVVRGKAPWGSYTMVFSSEGIRGFSEYCEANHVLPPAQDSSSSPGPEDQCRMRLCAKCVSVRTGSLRSVTVSSRAADGTESHFVVTGDISFKPGNNMEFSDLENGGIGLNAVAGAGAGKVPCECGDAPPNGSLIASPDGHTRIFNDTCYDLEPGPYGTRVVNGMSVPSRKLLVHAKCTACCTCGMYEAMVRRLAVIADSLRGSRSDIGDMLEKYEAAVKKFNDRVSTPDIGDVSLSLTGMPTVSNLGSNLSGSGVTGSMNRCAFSATMRNSSFVALDATVSGLGSDQYADIIEVTASWSSEDGTPLTKNSDSANGMSGTVFKIYPGRSLSLVFVAAKKDWVGVAGGVSYTGSVSLDLSYQGGYLGTVSKSVEVANDVQQ